MAVTKRLRLDAELVRRGLSESRASARQAVKDGRVTVRGLPATKADTVVSADIPIAIEGPGRRFVSRGGEKLDAALDRFGISVENRRWLDAGASTGGFTDCLLQRGAAAVAAVDVGYGQFDWSLRNHDRVFLLERTNVRALSRDDLPWIPQGVVADLSFISLRLVLPALRTTADTGADFVLLVKPQFEVGRERVGKGGVVSDPADWSDAVGAVVTGAKTLDLNLVDAAPSALMGPAGNVEFFVHLAEGAPHAPDAIDRAIDEATT
ncbi:MAG: TlyA family RNA methyltransferase [Actinomycetota bacterium]|nr:TlyA family RNA methyltransferase [Actinomycetota bacterium]